MTWMSGSTFFGGTCSLKSELESPAESFAFEAITALARGDVPSARTSIAQACDIDKKLFRLADAVYLACAEIEEHGKVTTSAWNALGDAVETEELLAAVESYRS